MHKSYTNSALVDSKKSNFSSRYSLSDDVLKMQSREVRTNKVATPTKLDAMEVEDTSSLLYHANERILTNGEVRSHPKKRYCTEENSLVQSVRSRKNDLLSAPQLPLSSSFPCNFPHSASSRKSSVQFKKLSFSTQIIPSTEKRLTLLGKPIACGIKNKQNATYRYSLSF